MSSSPRTRRLLLLTRAALVAALYVALTVTPPLSALSFGAIQVRVSEAMCVLPFFFPETGAGLILGCLISNFFNPNVPIFDVILGTSATVLSVAATLFIRCIKHRKVAWLVPLPAVLFNALIVPIIIWLYTPDQGFLSVYLLSFCTVGLGQIVACYGLGLPLFFVLRRRLVSKPERNFQ